MRALAATSCCSAERTSGRRSSRSEGRAAGTEGSGGSFSSPPRSPTGRSTSACGVRPSSTASALRAAASCCSRSGRRAAASAASASAWLASSSETEPARNRFCCSPAVWRREVTVWRVMSSCAASARASNRLRATVAVSDRRTPSRAASLAASSARAASVPRASRPHRSISQDRSSDTRRSLLVSGVPAGSGVEPTPLMRERLWFTPTVASGSCWPRAPRRLARASSMRATASARSRLCASASASKPSSTGSLKLRHQSSAILGTPAVPAGSSSAGRW